MGLVVNFIFPHNLELFNESHWSYNIYNRLEQTASARILQELLFCNGHRKQLYLIPRLCPT